MAYCHDGVGLGHFHRSLAISERVRRAHPASTFLLATGTPYVPIFDLPDGVDYIKLPAIAKSGSQTYSGKYLTTSIERIICCREAILLSAAQTFDPAVLLVDKAPSGVCGELLSTLRWLRRHHPQTRIVFGMRDIEDEPETTIEQWKSSGALEALEECYHEIWVYGMQSLFDVTDEYRLPQTIRDKLRFVGYVVQDKCSHDSESNSNGSVLVTVGGGTDGEFLLKTFLAGPAKELSAKGITSTIIGGPDLTTHSAGHLRQVASQIPGVEWLDYVSCMNCRIRQAGVVVSMGGYNTLCEIVSSGKPAVVVPRTTPRLEQTMRARLWSKRAAVDVIQQENLTPATLTDRVLANLEKGPLKTSHELDFKGLDRVSARFGEIWNGKEDARASALRV